MFQKVFLVVVVILILTGGVVYVVTRSKVEPQAKTVAPTATTIGNRTLEPPTAIPAPVVEPAPVSLPPPAPAAVTPKPAPTPPPAGGPTPAPAPAPKPGIYTMADVAKHNSASSCWSTINGGVYNLTSWIGQHPGGEDAILSLCGTDGSAAFQDQHGGQRRPANELAGFKIGMLAN